MRWRSHVRCVEIVYMFLILYTFSFAGSYMSSDHQNILIMKERLWVSYELHLDICHLFSYSNCVYLVLTWGWFFTKLHTSNSLNHLCTSPSTSQATLDSIHHVSTLCWWGTCRTHIILDFDANCVKMFRMQKFALIQYNINIRIIEV